MDNYINTKNELELVNLRLKVINQNELLLKKEKEKLTQLSCYLEDNLFNMDKIYKAFNGIENNLFYEIVFNGLNVTKAVDKVSFKHDKDVSTIWKNYYPNVKKKIEELKNKKPNC